MIRARKAVSISILFTFFVSASCFAGILEQSQMILSMKMGEKITRLCPKKECVVVGIGRSPAPVVAYLQSRNETDAFNLPLSSFKYGRDIDQPVLTEDEERELFEHFKRFPLLNGELGNRSVLVIDYAFTGDSAAASRDYIQKYLQKRRSESEKQRSESKVKLLVFGDLKEERMLELGIDYCLREADYEFGSNFLKERLKKVAEFGEYHLNEEKAPLVSSPIYLALVEEFKNEYDNMNSQIEEDELRKKTVIEEQQREMRQKEEMAKIVKAFEDHQMAGDLSDSDFTPERYYSRGIGIESVPYGEIYLDFVDGSRITHKETPYDVAAFVESKEVGERVAKMFFLGARVDYRPFEPNYVQVKVSVNHEHRKNLELLDRLTGENKNQVTPEIIKRARLGE